MVAKFTLAVSNLRSHVWGPGRAGRTKTNVVFTDIRAGATGIEMALAESLTADCPFASDQRVGKMPFKDVVDPEQLAVLTAVLNDICLAAGIDPQSPESEDSTGLLIHLYRIGCHTADELKDALEATRQQEWCC